MAKASETTQTEPKSVLDQSELEKLSFEQALERLETIVTAIEEGKIGLEESIEEYEKGMKLIQHCRNVLSTAEAKVRQLQLSEGGKVSTEPMDQPNEG